MALAVVALCGYLIGSINPAILISRFVYGKDVREFGSGNAGMTNMVRSFGKKAGTATLVADMAKGVLAVVLGRWLATLIDPVDAAMFDISLFAGYVAAIATILGHMFPIYFKFKGGKGVATSGGVILALQPVLALILIGIFLIIFFISKMVSLSSIIGISLYPVVTFIWCMLGFGQHIVFSTICSAVVAGLVVWMHRENIKRIASGTEYKFGQKKPREAEEPETEKTETAS
ncbi:glycerol-3-phosphate 1-O-acyltransferase PlsY [Clostridia bacterium OttesenSCG-928-O13]|nr:glycerol-3-phosphate 1-O-acyltransferase PlsY [Clostridia bacterium OttesenSCG-928-O13]